ncbi:MAG: transposase [Mycoplasmataceae bacterium]|jgi:transposase-like protein|nr:transposase [Mycoplasmataceae bacterium]
MKNTKITTQIKPPSDVKKKVILSLTKRVLADFIQTALKVELSIHLGYAKHDQQSRKKVKNSGNYRNGYYKKKIHSSYGEVSVKVPRDEKGKFAPIVIPKHTHDITEIEEKIIELYKGQKSVEEIKDVVCKIYSPDVSADIVINLAETLLLKFNQSKTKKLVKDFIIACTECDNSDSENQK